MLFANSLVIAQETTGEIRGVARDKATDDPLIGAFVQYIVSALDNIVDVAQIDRIEISRWVRGSTEHRTRHERPGDLNYYEKVAVINAG